MRTGLSFLIALGVATGPAGCARTNGTSSPALAATADFRGVLVSDTEGRAMPLRAALGGRVALLSFWAPWCEPCLKELPDLDKLARSVGPCGVAVMGVAVGESPATIASFARRRGLSFPQLTDENFHLADALGQRRIPTTMIFDREEHVVFVGDALDSRAIKALADASGCATEASFHARSR